MLHHTCWAKRLLLLFLACSICPGTSALADPPEFLSSFYDFEVSVDQLGYFVGTVEADDPEFDPVFYYLHGAPSGFTINSLHGHIYANLGSLDPGTYTFQVEAVDVFEESSFVDVSVEVVLGPPPEIVSFNFYRMGQVWVISGTVDSSTPGGTIKFGGLLNGKSTYYQADGQFMYMTMIAGTGQVSLQAIDLDGQESEVEFHYVQN